MREESARGRDRSRPRIEEPVYFVDDDGQRWRVWDYTYGPPANPVGKRTVRRPPMPDATYRAFVSPDGVERLYEFQRGEDRALTADHLTRQLRQAGYASDVTFDPTTHRHR